MQPQTEQSQAKSMTSTLTRAVSWLRGGLGWRHRALRGKIYDAFDMAELFVRNALGLSHPETTLISDSQQYWNDSSNQHLQQYSHWRGSGIFKDESRWLNLGLEHLRMYKEFARAVNHQRPLKRVAEWGCGGGMNAVHFGPLTEEFCGIDVSAASLGECEQQMESAGLHNFRAILIEAGHPEAAVRLVGGPCDLVISTYVFELLPTPEYGIRVLKIMRELLAPGGAAMIQIKYSDGNRATASRRWAYAKNLAWNATYRIEEFWEAAERCDFAPRLVTLMPKQPLVNDRNYAYFFCEVEPQCL